MLVIIDERQFVNLLPLYSEDRDHSRQFLFYANKICISKFREWKHELVVPPSN